MSLTNRHLSYDEEIEAIQQELEKHHQQDLDSYMPDYYVRHKPKHPTLLAYFTIHNNKYDYPKAIAQRLLDLVQEKRRFAHELELKGIQRSPCATDKP